jgi:hypothetical protein
VFDSSFSAHGISIFLVSTIISQVVYSFGFYWFGSSFRGGVGSMMIEVIPFLHSICRTVANDHGNAPEVIIPTVLVCYALSSVITGVAFFGKGDHLASFFTIFATMRELTVDHSRSFGDFTAGIGGELLSQAASHRHYRWSGGFPRPNRL